MVANIDRVSGDFLHAIPCFCVIQVPDRGQLASSDPPINADRTVLLFFLKF